MAVQFRKAFHKVMKFMYMLVLDSDTMANLKWPQFSRKEQAVYDELVMPAHSVWNPGTSIASAGVPVLHLGCLCSFGSPWKTPA